VPKGRNNILGIIPSRSLPTYPGTDPAFAAMAKPDYIRCHLPLTQSYSPVEDPIPIRTEALTGLNRLTISESIPPLSMRLVERRIVLQTRFVSDDSEITAS
jgi:hypothetical protein